MIQSSLNWVSVLFKSALTLLIVVVAFPSFAQEPVATDAAEVSVREITERLHRAAPGVPIDFSHRDLTYLDLSGINFKGARFVKADLYGADLTKADLRRADLSKTRLDRATLINADLRFANLSGATLLRPAVYRDMSHNLSDTPDFSGAELVGTRIQAKLSGARFRGANLTRSDLSPFEKRPGEALFVTRPYNEFTSCDFSGALLQHANLSRVDFTFSQFHGADFKQADVSETNFTKANLRGANLTGADVRLANFKEANLAGVIGLEQARHFALARNLDKAFAVPPQALKRWNAHAPLRAD